jgi:hydrogenase/urease accessory protein HupE
MTRLRIHATWRRLCLGLALAWCPLQVHAHLIETGLGPLYDGIGHFLLTPEDLIPALALALLAGLRGTAQARRLIFVLPIAWLAGGIAGAFSGTAAFIVPAWLPLLALGALVAADPKLPTLVTMAIATLLGLALGYANGTAMANAGAGVRGVLGIAAAVFVVTTLATAAVAVWQSGWLRIAWRVAGSWMAASGLLLLGWSLR